MRRELEPKCVPQLLLGSLLGTRRSAIGQFFSLSLAVPEVFAKVNSAQFPSRMADCSHTAGEDAMRYITQAPPPICYRYCIPFIPGIIRDPLLVGYFPLKPAGINGVFNKLES